MPINTIEEALAYAAAAFDEAASSALADAEAVLHSRGAAPEELRLELSRLAAEHAAERRRHLQRVRVWLETGHEQVH